MFADAFSSRNRPVLTGRLGAVSAAHPLAVAAAQRLLMEGGSAVDAAIAAQAVLCVLMPDACGLGGDVLALVRKASGECIAVNGSGCSPAAYERYVDDGAGSVTVPGLVDGWCALQRLGGALPLERALRPALLLARDGMRVTPTLAAALRRHRERLTRGGASDWPLLDSAAGALVAQPALGRLLAEVARDGRSAFYEGETAAALARAVQAHGGVLQTSDLAAHTTPVLAPVRAGWGDWRIQVQPPMTQGVLLAMAVQAWAGRAPEDPALRDHIGVELTQAAFAHRDEVGRGDALLQVPLPPVPARASLRGGPRAYLHTAGVAVADSSGTVVSSLVSVFDDFGSAVFVPELGITLNDRAAGFTRGPNAPAPGRRPVHTLAPVLVETPQAVLALATPGADGQVQTLLQVLTALRLEGLDLATAIARPRWRSEEGRLLVERSHPGAGVLHALGHETVATDDGDVRFGAVVCAGMGHDGPFCTADWRRETWAGVA